MNFKDILSFKTMLTPKIMRIYFIVIACVIALFTVLGFFGTLIQGGVMVLAALAVLIGGAFYLVIFRVFCEIMILFFAMHEELIAMRKALAGEVAPVAPAVEAQPQVAPVQTPEQTPNA